MYAFSAAKIHNNSIYRTIRGQKNAIYRGKLLKIVEKVPLIRIYCVYLPAFYVHSRRRTVQQQPFKMKHPLFSLLSIAALCLPFLASAQSLIVKSIEEERNATEASVNIRYDKSHNPCALVLVTIPGVPDATFEGTGIVDSFYSNYEYSVYVSEGTSEIRVKHPLAGERVIDFARQGIHIEPLKVYRALLYLEGAAGTPLQQSIDLVVMPQSSSRVNQYMLRYIYRFAQPTLRKMELVKVGEHEGGNAMVGITYILEEDAAIIREKVKKL